MPPRTTPSPMPDVLTDPVDWVRLYWRRYRIEGDEQRFLVMSSLLRYHRLVIYCIETEFRKFDINSTDFLVLMTLQLSESGTRLISSLAKNLMVHATTATLATDRLEARGLLFRSPHPTDRRATCVTISDAGRELLHKATLALDAVDFGLVGSNPDSLKQLGDVLTVLRDAAGDTGRTA